MSQTHRFAAVLALLPATVIADRRDPHPVAAPRLGAGQAPPAAASDERELDATAHQRYASVSGLSWHVDFEAAKAAARNHGRPILHLRMLGRLDEDLSCANSRLFRTTLYANAEVSRLLRDKFVLYWSTERPVPRVTIDLGDGRKLERTTTGNSAHYVMDADGHVLDVLPGLYAPIAFRRELEGSLALAAKVRGASDDDRARAIVAYHRAEADAAAAAWKQLAGTPWMPGSRVLLTRAGVESAIATAQLATVSKAFIEVPDLRQIMPDMPGQQAGEAEAAMWASAGQTLYGIGDLGPMTLPTSFGGPEPGRRAAALPAPPRVLDARSRALVARVHDEGLPEALRATPAARDAMLVRLEHHLVADTALNQLRLRPQISGEIVRRYGKVDFASLNSWIYANVFHTPSTDAWLGLLPRTDFSGLPGDGVVMP